MEMCVSENAVFEDLRFIACFIGKAGSQAFVKPESLEIFKGLDSQTKQEGAGIAGVQPHADGSQAAVVGTDIVGLKLEQAGGREGATLQYQIAGAFFAMTGKEKIKTDVVGIGFAYSGTDNLQGALDIVDGGVF